MRLVHGNGAKKVRGRNANEVSTLLATPGIIANVASTVSGVTLLDSVVDQSTGSYYDTAYTLSNPQEIGVSIPATIENLTPNIVEVNGPTVTRIVDGVGVIHAVDAHTTRELRLPVTRIGSATVTNTFKSYIPGTLGAKLADTLNTLVVGKVMGRSTIDMLTSAPTELMELVRNTNMFAASLDLSAYAVATVPLSVATTEFGVDQWAVTAISPRHVVSAWHARRSNGVFIGNDGSLHDIYIPTWQQIGTSDMAIGLCSTQLPASVVPMKTLPSNWRSYLPNKNLHKLPVFYAGHGPSMAIGGWVDGSYYHSGNLDNLETRVPDDAHQASFYNTSSGVSYSSGFPIFTAIDDTPLILGCWHAASLQEFGIAPMLADHITEINAAMASLLGASTYTIGTVDLSAYPTY